MSRKSKSKLVEEIRETRGRLDRNIDQLTRRLSPGDLVSQAGSYLNDSGLFENDNRRGKAVPAALIGLGAAWLFSNTNTRDMDFDFGDDDGRSYSEQAKAKARSLKYRAQRTASRTGDRISDSLDDAGDYTRRMARRSRRRAANARDYVVDTVEQNPLAAGAVTLGLGALVASLLPPTRVEDDYVGEYADEARNRATRRAAAGYREARVHAKDRLGDDDEHSENDFSEDGISRRSNDRRESGNGQSASSKRVSERDEMDDTWYDNQPASTLDDGVTEKHISDTPTQVKSTASGNEIDRPSTNKPTGSSFPSDDKTAARNT